jgi:hypothetical protein
MKAWIIRQLARLHIEYTEEDPNDDLRFEEENPCPYYRDPADPALHMRYECRLLKDHRGKHKMRWVNVDADET